MNKARRVTLLHVLPRCAMRITTKAVLGARPPREQRGRVAVAPVIICATVLRLSSSRSKRAQVRTGFIFPVGTPACADQQLLCAHESRYHQLTPLSSQQPSREAKHRDNSTQLSSQRLALLQKVSWASGTQAHVPEAQ